MAKDKKATKAKTADKDKIRKWTRKIKLAGKRISTDGEGDGQLAWKE